METELEKPKQKNIESQTILLIQDIAGEHGGHEIRVVKWIIDGKPTQSFLEKRQYRIQNEKKLFLKAKGFTKEDLNQLVESWDSISEAMNK